MGNHHIYYLGTYTSSEIIAQTTTFTVWIVVLHHFFKIFLAFYFYEFKNGGKGNISISAYLTLYWWFTKNLVGHHLIDNKQILQLFEQYPYTLEQKESLEILSYLIPLKKQICLANHP